MSRIMLTSALGLALSPFLGFKRRFPLFVYIVSRIVATAIMLLVLGFVLFGVIELVPDDVVDQISARTVNPMDGTPGLTCCQERYMRELMGLDQPFHVRYFRWLGRALRGDMGVTLVGRASVWFLVRQRLANTLLLNAISLAITSAAAFAIGIFFASKAGARADIAGTFATLLALSLPPLAVMLGLQLFAFATGLFPVLGFPRFPFRYDPLAFLFFAYVHHIFILVVANFVTGIGASLRLVRMLMLDQVGQPYIISLRARGISERRVFFVHAFRNALNPFLPWLGAQIAVLFAGSIMLETIFAYPGIGLLVYWAVFEQDANLLMVILLVVSATVMVAVLLADIALAFLDPRVKYGKG